MAFKIIAAATSAAISRSVTVSELKHTARLEDIQLELARKSVMRLSDHGQKLTEAKHKHAVWLNNLDDAGKAMYQESIATLQAAITPKQTSE